MDDPKKLKKQRPKYVKDPTSTGDPDIEPQINTDPMSQPQLGRDRKVIAPDPEAVREAERRKKDAEKGQ